MKSKAELREVASVCERKRNNLRDTGRILVRETGGVYADEEMSGVG